MKRYRIWPYRQGSMSAKSLSTALGGKVLRREGSRFVVRPRDVVINWGDPNPPPFVTHNQEGIRNASNKLHFFRMMRDAGLSEIIPEFWENVNEIPDDVFDNGGLVVCRTVLAGHSGDGIVLASSREELVPASLYVRYVKKQEEYRVHCGLLPGAEQPGVIAVQRKARRVSEEAPNWQIRNHANGFVFVRNEVNPPASVQDVALQSLRAAQLDFGAVDVIWNEKQQRAWVLEVNTAPGLEGQTVLDYANFFKGDE